MPAASGAGEYLFKRVQKDGANRDIRPRKSVGLNVSIKSLLSGQKANKFSWLAGMALSHLVASDESAVWIGIFSNIVTERTCSNV